MRPDIMSTYQLKQVNRISFNYITKSPISERVLTPTNLHVLLLTTYNHKGNGNINSEIHNNRFPLFNIHNLSLSRFKLKTKNTINN